ncbi:MAG: hypothetical protein HYZ23_08235 [Chloroflexi bacterium]|nr:hypothetical protein [Chloroflexota bacterium]
MRPLEDTIASAKLSQLREDYRVEVVVDWGYEHAGNADSWNCGTWRLSELEKLHAAINLMAGAMGGADRFAQNLGGVTIKKSNIGLRGGEAAKNHVNLSEKIPFSMWTVIHELAHAWDANHSWKLSLALEKYTGGYTRPILAKAKRLTGNWDAGPLGGENRPGKRGRLPGCNAAGYFYGDKPSGSNWRFNRKEDFAESVAMHLGWKKGNPLSAWADARIDRYLLPNGARDENFGVDNWADYAAYFYPPNGDYTKTKRWEFIDGLMREYAT